MTENTCPSCGLPKEDDVKDKPLCRYCFLRNTMGTMKFVIMSIFANGDKLSAEEVAKMLNKFEYIRRPVPLATVQKYLVIYTRFGMLSSSKERIKRVGRPTLLHTITLKGNARFEAYQKKWEDGHLVNLRKRHRKFRMLRTFIDRASKIRGKIRNDKDYNSFEFIFPQRNVKGKTLG